MSVYRLNKILAELHRLSRREDCLQQFKLEVKAYLVSVFKDMPDSDVFLKGLDEILTLK